MGDWLDRLLIVYPVPGTVVPGTVVPGTGCGRMPEVDTRASLALRAAQRLEARALEVGEHGAAGLALRNRAARLRQRALANRPYPALVCGSCLAVTGWLDRDGDCDRCLRARLLSESFADPHGSWVDLGDTRRPESSGERTLTRLFARRHERPARDEWRRLVDPGDTGPVDPEDGYTLDVAHRDELEAADRSCVLVRFVTSTHRFDGAEWVKLESTTVAAGAILTPTTFPTDLPIEQLAEAWGDYRNEVHTLNSSRWETTSSARESDRRARAAREAREASVSGLLDED